MSDKRYVGSGVVAKRYARTPRTVARWSQNPPAGFPRPLRINGKNLWDLAALEAYEVSQASQSGVA